MVSPTGPAALDICIASAPRTGLPFSRIRALVRRFVILEGSGALAAAEAVQRDIATGCDLVLLSKFGKLEAAGKGLSVSFKAAIDSGIPLLTSVSRTVTSAWEAFAAAGFTVLSADSAEIDGWIEACWPRQDRGGRYGG